MELVNLLKYIFALGGAFLLADIFTRYIVRRCNETELLDSPSSRKLHEIPTPRLGGLAVVTAFSLLSFFIVQVWGDLSVTGQLSPLWWYSFIGPAILLLVVGLADDVYELSPLVKLSGQISAATLLFSFGTSVGSIATFELNPILDYCFTTFWFLLVINALNLIDGLDGLASGLAAIAAAGLFGIFMISNEVFAGLIMLAFIGAVGGFLKHNFHPAKIFLGDCGSMFLGFSLAAFTLVSPSKGSTVATLGACVLALGVPILDTALAVWRRSLRKVFSKGNGVMSADMDHLHHRLVKRGFNQRKVALTMYALSAGLVAVGLLSLLFSSYAHGIYLIAFTLGTYIVLRHLANVELWDSGTVLARGITRPSGATMTAFLYPLADVLVMSVALFLAVELGSGAHEWSAVRQLYVALLPVWVGTCFLVLGLSATYKRVWSRARVSEFVYLVLGFAFGTLLSAGVTKFLGDRALISDLVLFTTLYFGIGAGLLTALRALPRTISDLMFLNSAMKGVQIRQRRVLVVGADVLYLRHIKNFDWSSSSVVPFKVIGLVDADANLRRRIVHGYHVLGTPDELPRLLAEFEIDEIVIAGNPTGVDRAEIIGLGKRYGITVKEWVTKEEILVTIESAFEPEDFRVVSR